MGYLIRWILFAFVGIALALLGIPFFIVVPLAILGRLGDVASTIWFCYALSPDYEGNEIAAWMMRRFGIVKGLLLTEVMDGLLLLLVAFTASIVLAQSHMFGFWALLGGILFFGGIGSLIAALRNVILTADDLGLLVKYR